MDSSTVLLLLVVLACPLMMNLMMRGGHGHGGGHAGHRDGLDVGHGHASEGEPRSPEGLRRRRDELDRLIEQCEHSEAERELEPSGPQRQ